MPAAPSRWSPALSGTRTPPQARCPSATDWHRMRPRSDRRPNPPAPHSRRSSSYPSGSPIGRCLRRFGGRSTRSHSQAARPGRDRNCPGCRRRRGRPWPETTEVSRSPRVPLRIRLQRATIQPILDSVAVRVRLGDRQRREVVRAVARVRAVGHAVHLVEQRLPLLQRRAEVVHRISRRRRAPSGPAGS